MLTQSAHNALFRIQAPNSSARDILVVPLDEVTDAVVASVAREPWRNVRFVPCTAEEQAWRSAFAERMPDIVIMIGKVGAQLGHVTAIGEICLIHHIKVSGVLIRVREDQLSDALRLLRPWAQTIAVVPDIDYLPELLQALGA